MRGLGFLASFLAAAAVPAAAQAAAAPAARVTSVTRPRIEVAFVLDTTGSMSGLIEGAKRKIWSIAEKIGDGRPRPDLRIALVAYRDVGDQYVTQVFDFTPDMDAVFERLSGFRAEGGGDTPEHVSRALSDAVHRVTWSDGNTMKTIFLVGDAPPHTDYQDGYDYRRHAREAAQRGIVVETIECGGDPQTERFWNEIATLANGHFARIDGNGGMPARVTPADAELARLNRELARTVVAGGSSEEQKRTEQRMANRAAMPASAAAEAASYFAKSDRLAERDLVDLSLADQKKALAEQAAGRLDAPPPLKGKSESEALAYLKQQKDERAALQAKILALQKDRETYLKKTEADKTDGFDAQVLQQLKERAAALGIKY